MKTETITQVAELKKAFADVDRISLKNAEKLGKIMDAAPLACLIGLVKGNVKFCAGVARNRLWLVHGWTWDQIADLNTKGN